VTGISVWASRFRASIYLTAPRVPELLRFFSHRLTGVPHQLLVLLRRLLRHSHRAALGDVVVTQMPSPARDHFANGNATQVKAKAVHVFNLKTSYAGENEMVAEDRAGAAGLSVLGPIVLANL
jgi:hypothetical protein